MMEENFSRIHERIDRHDRELAAQARELELLRKSHEDNIKVMASIYAKLDSLTINVHEGFGRLSGGAKMGMWITGIFITIGAISFSVWQSIEQLIRNGH